MRTALFIAVHAALLCVLHLVAPRLSAQNINVGGPSVVVGGTTWEADKHAVVAGQPYQLPASAALPSHLMDLRWGNLLYEIPAASGRWDVTLSFADPLVGGTPGARAFSININGTTVEPALDVISSAGGALRSLDRTYRVAADGVIRIQLTASVRNAILNAVSLKRVPDPPAAMNGWCPEPALAPSGTTITVGPGWTPEMPCYVHQNMTIGVDPLHVQRLTAPTAITVRPGTITADLWIALTGPAGSAPGQLVVMGDAAPGVGYTVRPHTTPRLFPAGSTPVGIAYVREGVLLPVAHSFLGRQQFYIDGALPMAVVSGDGGFRFVLSPAQAAQQARENSIQRREAQLAAARSELLVEIARAQLAILRAPVGGLHERIAALESAQAALGDMGLQRQWIDELVSRHAARDDEAIGQVMQLSARLDEMHVRVEQAEALARVQREKIVIAGGGQ